jgi:hypothetical protein
LSSQAKLHDRIEVTTVAAATSSSVDLRGGGT